MGHKFAATFVFLAIIYVITVTLPQSVYGAGQTIKPVLDEHIGWFIVVGLSTVSAVVISAEIKIKERYLGVKETSEWFNTAGRVIKTGLTAAAIVSAWT